jgi:ankyrin repeat protein
MNNMKRTTILTAAAVLLVFLASCGQGQNRAIDKSWYGIYEYQSPEFDAGLMTLSDTYTLEIKPDSCSFKGEGYQLYFGCTCTVEQTAPDVLTFYFSAHLYGNSDFMQVEPYIVKLSRKGGKYYFNSPYIFVEENNNTDVEAVRVGQEQSTQSASEQNTDIYPQLMAAIEANDQNSFDKLIKQVPDIDFLIPIDDEGNSASLLGYACQYQRCDLAKKLINRGANIEIGKADEYMVYDALSVAVLSEEICLVKLLLDNGANPNRMLSENGLTVLSLISWSENGDIVYEIAKLLIEKGANVDGLGDTGFDYINYPLLYAIQGNHIKLVQLLFDHHCEIDIRDNEGDTPFTVAKRTNNQQMYDLVFKNFMKKIKLSILEGNKEWMANHIQYPVTAMLNGENKITINNKQQLTSNFDQIFYPAFKEKIKASNVDELSTNQYGTMLGDGWIWVENFSSNDSIEYKIYAINNDKD